MGSSMVMVQIGVLGWQGHHCSVMITCMREGYEYRRGLEGA